MNDLTNDHPSIAIALESDTEGAVRIAAALDTISFQARGFYEKQGYTIFGVQEDYPPGHRRFFLRKIWPGSDVQLFCGGFSFAKACRRIDGGRDDITNAALSRLVRLLEYSSQIR